MYQTLKSFFYKFTLLFILVLVMVSCKDPDPEPPASTLEINFAATIGGEKLQFYLPYQHPLGYFYQIELLMSYFDDIYLIDDVGEEVELAEILLVKYHDHTDASSTKKTFEVRKGTYQGISFGIGVGADKNNEDPSVYAAEHPLSIFHGTHWDWNTGYIFTKIEGRFNNNPGEEGSFNRTLNYHIGLNELYHRVELPFEGGLLVEDNSTQSITINIDLQKVLEHPDDLIDLDGNNSTHTFNNFELAERISLLFKQAFSIE